MIFPAVDPFEEFAGVATAAAGNVGASVCVGDDVTAAPESGIMCGVSTLFVLSSAAATMLSCVS